MAPSLRRALRILRSRTSTAAGVAARAAPVAARDLAGVTGAVLIVHGAGLIYAPAGWIAGGSLLLAAAWLSARRAP